MDDTQRHGGKRISVCPGALLWFCAGSSNQILKVKKHEWGSSLVYKHEWLLLYTLEVGDKHWISNPIRAVQHRTLHRLVIDLQHISSTYMCAFLRDWLRDVITNFETCWGFPQTVGVIDVTHIPIACLQESASDYYSRKGYYSVIIQAVVGYGGLFIDAYIGCPRSIHDARVMVNSYLYQRAMNGTLLPDRKRLISGVQVCLFILGDPAYLACLG